MTVILVVFSNLKAQETGSVNTDSLKFLLEIVVNDIYTDKPIEGAQVWVVGTDGSSNKDLTNEYGKTSVFNLSSNTSYSIHVNKKSYMLSKGKESTIDKNSSVTFFHKYEMYQIIECPIILYEQYYKHNKTQPYIAKSSLDTISKKVPVNYYHDIMKDHPNIVVKIIGYQDCTENEGISKLRAEIFMKQLIKLGIDKNRIVVADGGIKEYKEFGIKRDASNLSEKLKENNRLINFQVIETNYQDK